MKNILDYQKTDAKVLQLKRKVDNSKTHDTIKEMASVYKQMQTKLFDIEDKAEGIKKDYNETLKTYKKNLESSKKLASQKVEEFKDESLNEELEKANQISSQLFMLERKLNILLTTINNTLKDFETTKNKAFSAKKKHSDAKTDLQKLKDEVQPKIDELIKQLKSLEKDLDKELFKKYNTLKNENIFPVFVPLLDKNCGYCRVELSNLKLDDLKKQRFITCEQCRRIIFNEEN